MFQKPSIGTYILLGIILILLVLVIFRKTPPSPNSSLQQHTKDSLIREISRAKDSVAHFYEGKLKSLDSSFKAKQDKINSNDTKIKEVYKAYERKVNTVNSWDVDSLQRFFSDRYGSNNDQ